MRCCIVCGRELRTGIKYCYTCRGHQIERSENRSDYYAWVTSISSIIVGFTFIFGSGLMKTLGYISFLIGIPILFALIAKYISKKKERLNP